MQLMERQCMHASSLNRQPPHIARPIYRCPIELLQYKPTSAL